MTVTVRLYDDIFGIYHRVGEQPNVPTIITAEYVKQWCQSSHTGR